MITHTSPFLGPRSYFLKVSLDYNEKITIRQVRKGCSYPYIMTRILEKMSLLGLSLLLISAFSISTALPPMLDYYSPSFSAAQVELLVSVPSFSVVAMLLLNSFIDKWLSDRQLIVTGLLLLSSAGIFPFLYKPILLFYCHVLLLEWGLVLSMLRRLPSSVNVIKVKSGFRC